MCIPRRSRVPFVAACYVSRRRRRHVKRTQSAQLRVCVCSTRRRRSDGRSSNRTRANVNAPPSYTAATENTTGMMDDDAPADGPTAGRSTSQSFKVVLLGEGCVGKTSLVLRYTEDKFTDRHVSTLQVRDGCFNNCLLRPVDVVVGYVYAADVGTMMWCTTP